MNGGIPAAIGMPMEGFFDGADVMVEAMASASVVAQGALAKAPISPPKLVSVKESTQTERVGEFVPILTEVPTPKRKSLPHVHLRLGALLLLLLLSSLPVILLLLFPML